MPHGNPRCAGGDRADPRRCWPVLRTRPESSPREPVRRPARAARRAFGRVPAPSAPPCGSSGLVAYDGEFPDPNQLLDGFRKFNSSLLEYPIAVNNRLNCAKLRVTKDLIRTARAWSVVACLAATMMGEEPGRRRIRLVENQYRR